MRAAVLTSLLALALLEAAARLLPLGLPDRADRHAAWSVGAQPAFVPMNGSLTTAPELARQGNSPATFSYRKEPGSLRVICVGDSTTAGWPVNPEGAYPRWLAAILADARPDLRFEVINAGFHDFDSTRALSVARELAPFSPDALVLHAGYDDYHLYPLRSSRAFALDSWLRLHFRVYDLALWLRGRRSGGYSLQPRVPRLTSEQNDAVVASFIANVRAFEELARSARAAAILTDMPFARSREPNYPGWPALEAMRSGQRELAERDGWTLAALAALDTEARFVDHVHSDAEGYRLIALDVAHALERSGRFPGRWRWDRVRSARAMSAALGLDDPRYQAYLHLRLAGYFLSKRDPGRVDAELAAALRAAPDPDIIPDEVARAHDAALSESLARARHLIGYASNHAHE